MISIVFRGHNVFLIWAFSLSFFMPRHLLSRPYRHLKEPPSDVALKNFSRSIF